MKHNTIKKRKISRDCWDLDYAFFRWLGERLPVYLKEAGKIIDLEFRKFEFRGKEYTQKELIERMIYLIRASDKNEINDLDWDKWKEVLEIWAVVAPAMWW